MSEESVRRPSQKRDSVFQSPSQLGSQRISVVAGNIGRIRVAKEDAQGMELFCLNLQDFWFSSLFEGFIVLVVVLYAALLVVESSVEDGEDDEVWVVVEIALLGVLMGEVLLKSATFGERFIFVRWNIYDSIVITTTFGLLVGLSGKPKELFRALRFVIIVNRFYRVQKFVSAFRARRAPTNVSPAEQTLKILHELKAKYALDAEDERGLEYVLELIAGNKLYSTDTEQLAGADAETSMFIMNNLSYGMSVSQNHPTNSEERKHQNLVGGSGRFKRASGMGSSSAHLSIGSGHGNNGEVAVTIAPGSPLSTEGLSQGQGHVSPLAQGSIHRLASNDSATSAGSSARARATSGGSSDADDGEGNSDIALTRVCGPLPAPLLARVSSELDNWDFDVFAVHEQYNEHSLVLLGFRLLRRWDLQQVFSISDATAVSFFSRLERGYKKSNPYHNSIHAADVLQTAHFFCARPLLRSTLTNLDVLAALLAAAMHDFEHPGTNNAFQINTRSRLALLYNDASVLESHHVAATFLMMQNHSDADVLAALPTDSYREARGTMISMVLATDMRFHFEEVSHFKTQVLSPAQGPPGIDAEKVEERRVLLKMLLHCADVSNPAKPLALYRHWTSRVMEEFHSQGDMEAARGLEVSMFMDRERPSTPKCQIGFIQFIVAPLYDAWSDFLQDIKPMLEAHLNENLDFWKAEKEKEDEAGASSSPRAASSRVLAPAASPTRSPQAAPPAGDLPEVKLDVLVEED